MSHTRMRIAALVISALIFSGCSSSTQPVRAPHPSATATKPSTTSSRLRQQWLDMFARGYFPGRSGQVFVVPKEGWFVTSRDPLYRFMHGSPWEYDTHIPLLLYGTPFVKPGQFTAPAKQQDIAPTVGAVIGASPLPTY